ncbi:hypothetical protein IV38_GL001591 [Lactobacillus selangorensis]|uniref:Penicillin-binding protein n=1 Tax=Lactobacillus selangorensis TaxID=81857 RepID=A0A0R2FZV5_9LACO|nr:hypothetical protein [Lactobacillus selangorensis]KRN28140.1 hypothetical protein IV38_GL001591 [Lactobacillus selangorensis]KRN30983.1 hypothetical protein IV40_GL001624 [Lactobacillus selangorensis]
MHRRRRLKKQYRILLRVIVGVAIILAGGRIVKGMLANRQTTQQAEMDQAAGSSSATNHSNHVVKLGNTVNVNQALQTAWQKVLKGTTANVDIAVYSPKTGRTYTYSVKQSDDATFPTASILKVTVMAAVLHQNQTNGTTLTSTEQSEMQAMIENSDNDACTDLLDNVLGGNDGNDATYSALGMTGTTADMTGWAMTTTTAADQLKVLNAIFYGADNYLTKSERTYAMSLMSTVESDQDWGISAGATHYQLKNGWRLEDNGDWIVNSIGHVGKTSEQGYTIAVLTNDNATQDDGEKVVENLAAATKTVLN